MVVVVVAILNTVGVGAELGAQRPSLTVAVAAYAIGVAAAGVLLLRRVRPFACAVVVLGLVAGYHIVGAAGAAPALALFVALYTLAEQAATAWWIAAAVVIVPVWMAVAYLPPTAAPPGSFAVIGPAIGMLWLIVLGVAMRQLRRANARQVELATAQAEAAAHERLAEDRLRIARDVHDVLAHTISAAAVQSAAALDAFDAGEPERAREALLRIRSLTRQARPALRDAVEHLRGDTVGRTPQPGIGDIDDLIATARHGGLVVDAEIAEEAAAASTVTAMAAYRIVQEALTNVIKHARASRVRVALRPEGGSLIVDVVDDGVGTAGDPPLHTGFGLIGLRERAASVGGHATANALPGNGFAVRAELPLDGGGE